MSKLVRSALMTALAAVVVGLGSARAASPQVTLSVSGNTVSGVPGLTLGGGHYSFGGNDSYVYISNSGAYLTTSTTLLSDNTKFNGQFWGYAFQVKVTDNAPGDATGAQLFDVTSDVLSNRFAWWDSETVSITLQDSTFVQPTGSVYLQSIVQGTTPGWGSDTFQSFFVQSGNNRSTTAQSIDTSLSTVNSSTFTNSGSFTLKNVTTVTLGSGETSSTNGRTYLLPVGSVNAVPEPATTTLALTGLAAFGLVGLRRRRLAKTSV